MELKRAQRKVALPNPRKTKAPERDPLLAGVGAQVRRTREAQDLSRRELALACGVSERFLADLEAGTGNISLQRLDAVARALQTRLSALLGDDPLAALTPEQRAEAEQWLRARFGASERPLVALIGLRGAGKSTVGRRLAQRLEVPFVELDERVEQAAGLSLAGLFQLHGEAYYRRLAREVLTRLLAESSGAVIATGGSLVTDPEAFRLLQRRCRTVWLQATAEDHWRRVLAQGDTRPGADRENAQAELRALLQARTPLYAQAELAVDTSRLGVEGTVAEVLRALAPR